MPRSSTLGALAYSAEIGKPRQGVGRVDSRRFVPGTPRVFVIVADPNAEFTRQSDRNRICSSLWLGSASTHRSNAAIVTNSCHW
jgi:hypothetical protein